MRGADSWLHDPHGVAPYHLRAAAGAAAGEIERIVLWREQVRGHDHGDRRLIRGRARHDPIAAPQDLIGRRIRQPNSIARKVVRFELQLEANAIHAGGNAQGSGLERQLASEEAEQPPRFVLGARLVSWRARRKPEGSEADAGSEGAPLDCPAPGCRTRRTRSEAALPGTGRLPTTQSRAPPRPRSTRAWPD